MHHAPDIKISHYENFPVASILCPPHLRAPIAAIYHFARTADDMADEGSDDRATRLAALADYRQQLVLAAQKNDQTQTFDTRWQWVFLPLQHAIATHRLPTHLLHHLLDAFVLDAENTGNPAAWATDAQLMDYCRLSANPVGRLLLHLYQVHDPALLDCSDAICTALQLANFWQDAGKDIARGRIYFTAEMQARSGTRREDLLALRQTPQVTRMLQECVHTARALMHSGARLVHHVPGRSGWELRLVVQGGLRMLDKIEAMGFATLQKRPTLHAGDYALMLQRALWM